MSHEIEADYIEDYHNEEKRCPHCNSYQNENKESHCKELEQKVSSTATCDFFQSIN